MLNTGCLGDNSRKVSGIKFAAGISAINTSDKRQVSFMQGSSMLM